MPNTPAARANDACKHLLTGGSTEAGSTTTPATSNPSGPGAAATDCLTLASPCYTPRQLRVAYGFQPLLDRGITGRGQTVVLPEFPPSAGSPSTGTGARVPASSDIRQDLARFDSLFHLPAAKLQVVNTLAHAPSPWQASIEEVADTEVVHALAPGADHPRSPDRLTLRRQPGPGDRSRRRRLTAQPDAGRRRLAQCRRGGTVLHQGRGRRGQLGPAGRATQARHHDLSTGDSGAATTACPPEHRLRGV